MNLCNYLCSSLGWRKLSLASFHKICMRFIWSFREFRVHLTLNTRKMNKNHDQYSLALENSQCSSSEESWKCVAHWRLNKYPGRWFSFGLEWRVFFSRYVKECKRMVDINPLPAPIWILKCLVGFYRSTWNKYKNVKKRQIKREHLTIIITIIRFRMIASHYWKVSSKIIKKSLLRWKHDEDQLIMCTYSFP